MSKGEFEDISIPKWKLATNGVIESTTLKIYRVFSTPTEFVSVEAANATEAATKSGITKIYMIRIGARDDMTMLDRTMLAAEIVAAAAVAEVAPVAPPEAPVAQ